METDPKREASRRLFEYLDSVPGRMRDARWAASEPAPAQPPTPSPEAHSEPGAEERAQLAAFYEAQAAAQKG